MRRYQVQLFIRICAYNNTGRLWKLRQVFVTGLRILKSSPGTCPWALNTKDSPGTCHWTSRTESFTKYFSLDFEFRMLYQVLVPGLWILSFIRTLSSVHWLYILNRVLGWHLLASCSLHYRVSYNIPLNVSYSIPVNSPLPDMYKSVCMYGQHWIQSLALLRLGMIISWA